jgi:predicted HTH transcriptional regulator
LACHGLPGYCLIETTLDFICELADEKGHPLTKMKYAQFRMPTDQRVLQLIRGGEHETCELNSTLRTNLHTGTPDRVIEHAALKTLAALLNKRGGSLLIGVEDDGTALGLAEDKFPNTDKLILHFTNLIRITIPDALDLIRFTVVPAEGREVLLIDCKRGKQPIHLKNRDTKDDEFYVRRGPSTDRLGIREAFAYIQRNFPDDDPAANA